MFKANANDSGRGNNYQGDWGKVHERDVYHARDEGEYLILQARYGTAERNVDVTQRLKELARQDRTFRMGNDSFGVDPHPNQVKTLRIFARGPDAQVRTFEYREGGWVDGAQYKSWGGGNWGQRDAYHGGWSADRSDSREHDRSSERRDDGEYQILQARYGTEERNVDVTQRLKELASRDRTFRMGNDSFGTDPHPNRVKTLRIYARGNNGETRTFEYSEGSSIDGAKFKAWGGGDWGRNGAYSGGWGNSQNASRDRNSNDYQSNSNSLTIVSAQYGVNNQSIDVTQMLRSRVRDGRL
jgi:hypothetical protein